MASSAFEQELSSLLAIMDKGLPALLGAIPWAAPVISFGSPAASRIATLGLNPSNLEFVDSVGNPLVRPHNRFESLSSLTANSWNEVYPPGVRRIWESCEDYFSRNPYNRWFRPLDKVLVHTGASFYSRNGRRACHLDLVPFATRNKWSALGRVQRARLVAVGIQSLARTLRASDIRVLVLNGSSVVKEFSRWIAPEAIQPQIMPSWSLQYGRVQGVAHLGRVSEVGDLPLQRDLLVLGFNHNIQSSFGVTNQVVSRIATWIGRQSVGVLA